MDLFNADRPKRTKDDEVSIRPLADRMRPVNFDEFVGQEKIVGVGTPLRKAIESDKVGSMIFWGPPAPERRPWRS